MIYFDHAATTPLHEDVIEVIDKVQKEVYGNPSSIHQKGREAKQYLAQAREGIASYIGAREDEVIFTSGGTEANNLAIIGSVLARQDEGKHIITTNQEHHAVLHVMEYLESIGFSVTYIQTDASGRIRLADVRDALRPDTIFASIMMVNNETGIIQPIEEIASLLQETNVTFHTDAVQALGSLPLHLGDLGVDLCTVSAHKVNGPKGVGLLYKKRSVTLHPLVFGGNQEAGLRAGTENLLGIIGFHYALQALKRDKEEQIKHIEDLYERLTQMLEQEAIPFEINGDMEHRSFHIMNIYFPWVKNDVLLTNLDLANIAVSSGSACTAGTIEASHVLIALFGEGSDRIFQSIRISFGRSNTIDEVTTLVSQLKHLHEKLA